MDNFSHLLDAIYLRLRLDFALFTDLQKRLMNIIVINQLFIMVCIKQKQTFKIKT